ncbi:MAG: asparagine synthase (glutamine-hydrolyzing), partial [Fervidicoccaceae archaeon]
RLSILDPSPKGHQPMFHDRFAIVLNGEVYNYREVREELRSLGHTFESDSDTEVVLKAVAEWGIESALNRLLGMYAFLIYDSREKKLCGARDRFGIKPLHYMKVGDAVYFSSEIKAFRAVANLRPNARRVVSYLSFLRGNPEETFFEGVYSIPPAYYFCSDGESVDLKRYWSPEVKERSWEDSDAIEKWRSAFESSVKLHLRTDVPLAIALSGGLDSSSILAETKKLLEEGLKEKGFSRETLKIFTVSVDDSAIDELEYAKSVARFLGMEDNMEVVKVKAGDLSIDDLRKMIYYLEEPPEGPSSILHWMMMKKIRERAENLKVLLNGQGGDELLAGYHAYIPIYLKEVMRKRGLLTGFLEAWKLRKYIAEKITLGLRVMLGMRMRMSERILTEKGRRMIERRSNSFEGLNDALRRDLFGGRLLEILRTEDRSSMAYSIEIRVPFVNHALAELSLSMPSEMKIRDGYTKWIHRKAVEGMLPREIVWNRRKIGFQAPEKKWMFSLGEKFEELMEDSRLVKMGIVRRDAVQEIVQSVKRGKVKEDYARFYWRLFFAELWLRTYFE